MAQIIRGYDNKNIPIVDGDNETLQLVYFNLIKLSKGECLEQQLNKFETLYVVLSGSCDLHVDGETFHDVGKREGIWTGSADSVYVPVGARVQVRGSSPTVEIAVAGGRCDQKYTPFRVTPDEVEMVDVGSNETKSRRRIFHILGQNGVGRCGNLLVSELYADEGCWSGYPPHKHDDERGDEETAHEELYHYRFRPENGFGAQLTYNGDGTSQCFMTHHGDTYLLDRGYHPTVTSPGHEEYIFTILVGKHRRSLIQSFEAGYTHLMKKIPGIQSMRDKFK